MPRNISFKHHRAGWTGTVRQTSKCKFLQSPWERYLLAARCRKKVNASVGDSTRSPLFSSKVHVLMIRVIWSLPRKSQRQKRQKETSQNTTGSIEIISLFQALKLSSLKLLSTSLDFSYGNHYPISREQDTKFSGPLASQRSNFQRQKCGRFRALFWNCHSFPGKLRFTAFKKIAIQQRALFIFFPLCSSHQWKLGMQFFWLKQCTSSNANNDSLDISLWWECQSIVRKNEDA